MQHDSSAAGMSYKERSFNVMHIEQFLSLEARGFTWEQGQYFTGTAWDCVVIEDLLVEALE